MKKKHTIEKITSTEIVWKSDEVNPTIEKKKKKIKKGKETKIITKVTECDSFFNFFKNYDNQNSCKKTKEEEDNEEDEEHEHDDNILEDELELGNQIRDEIIPYSIEYYLGIAGGDEMDCDMEDEEEEEDEPEEEKKAPLKGGKGKIQKH